MLYKLIKLIIITILLSSCASYYNFDFNKNNQAEQNSNINNKSESNIYNRFAIINKNNLLANSNMQFIIKGRFFVSNIDKNNKNFINEYGNFLWQKTNQNEIIELNSPLGLTLAKIIMNDNNKQLLINNHLYVDQDFDNLLQAQLGFNLPIDKLYFWLCGYFIINHNYQIIDSNSFTQDTWLIIFVKWQSLDNLYNSHFSIYPKLIIVNNNKLQIKLLITSFEQL